MGSLKNTPKETRNAQVTITKAKRTGRKATTPMGKNAQTGRCWKNFKPGTVFTIQNKVFQYPTNNRSITPRRVVIPKIPTTLLKASGYLVPTHKLSSPPNNKPTLKKVCLMFKCISSLMLDF